MVLLIPNGKRLSLSLAAISLSICATYAQSPVSSGQCTVSSVPSQVRAEGLTERLGNIIFQCSNYPASAVVSGNLTVFLPVAITNRIDANNNALDAVLLVDSGSGFTPTGIAGKIAGNNIAFQGLSVTVPASGAFNLEISSVRIAAYQFGFSAPQSINANISGPFPLAQSTIAAAYVQTGLYATLYSTGITCVGSPVPSTVTLSNLFAAQTAFASTRVTEGFATAFQAQSGSDDTGTRFIVSYSGFPSNATVYVPDFVAGSDAAIPTAGGDLGGAQSGGEYVPGSGTLLLARVQYTDSTGAGGYVTALPAGGGVFNGANPVPLTNGAGIAVYQVMDANPNAVEDAQFPTFIALPNVTAPAVAQERISFAPVSTVMTASATAPVPRFEAVIPPSDCSIVGDCQAGYFPKLSASTSGLSLMAASGALSNQGFIAVDNAAGGIMNWSAAAGYNQGSGWLTLSPASGQNDGTVTLRANAQGLAAGTYTANVVISAGSLAGSQAFPVTFTVTAASTSGTSGTGGTGGGAPAPAPAPSVIVSSVVNAASLASGPLVGGSLSTVLGSNLAGANVAVTFDGNPATLLYSSATQINLQVPAEVASETASTMVVTVDGASSAPQTLPVSAAWPAIFSNGVLNQDNSVNGPSVAASAGAILQIFLTGIPANAAVTAVIGNQTNLTPLYAGPAPGIAGVQQVNVAVPAGAGGGGSTQVAVCATAGGRQFCSTGLPLYVK
jgi:uncharacterized protein (TIGR03437 family)